MRSGRRAGLTECRIGRGSDRLESRQRHTDDECEPERSAHLPPAEGAAAPPTVENRADASFELATAGHRRHGC